MKSINPLGVTRVSAFLICLVVYLFVVSSYFELSAIPQSAIRNPQSGILRFSPGDRITDLPLIGVDRKPFPLKKFLGKKVIVFVFYLDVCEKCLKQMKEMDDFLKARKLKDRVDIVAVARGATDEEIAASVKALKGKRLPFHTAFDPDLLAAHSMGVTMVPAFVAIDKSGDLLTPAILSLTESDGEMNFLDFLSAVAQGGDVSYRQLLAIEEEPAFMQLVGQSAPDFGLDGLDGRTYRLEDFYGQYLLVFFWDIECVPCQKQLVVLQRYYENNSETHDFEVLGIVNIKDEDVDMAQSVLTNLGVTFAVAGDRDTVVRKNFLVDKSPALFVVNRDGQIVGARHGLVSDLSVFLDPVLQK
ncbi:MAG: TlpA disulfide reductase family protein [bacterium]